MGVLLGLLVGWLQEGAFLVAFSGHFPVGKQSTEEKSLQQGAFAALSPVLERSRPCTWSPFPFPCAEPELGFLLQAAQSHLQGAGAEASQAGRMSDPVRSTETFQPSAFGKAWAAKPRLGEHQLGAKIIIFTQEVPGVLFLKFSLVISLHRDGFG